VTTGVSRKIDVAQTYRDLTRLAIGLKLHRQTHGSYPSSLEALRQGGWTVPKDVFTGADLIYRRQDEAYLLYSVGYDEDDDGGRQVNLFRRGYKEKPGDPPIDDGDIVWGK